MRAAVVDVVFRHLKARGYNVTYVKKNFTDIDDKIIDQANKEGVDIYRITERYIRNSMMKIWLPSMF